MTPKILVRWLGGESNNVVRIDHFFLLRATVDADDAVDECAHAVQSFARRPARRALIKFLIDLSYLVQGLNKRTRHLPVVILSNKSLSCTK